MTNVDKSNSFRDVFSLKSRSNTIVCGVGINDADYMTAPAGMRCPAYVCWKSMLVRCYSSNYIDKRPTYENASVCEEWMRFMSFRDWWLKNSVDGFDLDKDILSNGVKLYSPSTCIFIPKWLNSFTLDAGARRGLCKIGVSYHVRFGKFFAHCRNQITNKLESLGGFDNENDAHERWKSRKLELAAELKDCMDSIDIRIYKKVLEIIERAE